MIREILYYMRRVLAEFTGRPFGRKLSTAGIKKWQPTLMVAAGSLIVIILIAIIWAVLPFGKNGVSNACAFRISEEGAPEPVTAGDAVKLDVCVTLEKAASPSSRTLGLSNRPAMPRDRGMLFDFEVPGEYCMWMKDMHFSLDMIWLSEDQEILDIKGDISPDTYPQAFCGPENSRYVIEVNAGVTQSADLRTGQRLSL